jgi:hypothetical protein
MQKKDEVAQKLVETVFRVDPRVHVRLTFKLMTLVSTHEYEHSFDCKDCKRIFIFMRQSIL